MWSNQADSVRLFQDLFKSIHPVQAAASPLVWPQLPFYLVVTLPLAPGPEDTWAFPEPGSSECIWLSCTLWHHPGRAVAVFHLFHPARLLFGCGEKILFLHLMGSTFILGVCFVLLMDCPSEKFLPKAGWPGGTLRSGYFLSIYRRLQFHRHVSCEISDCWLEVTGFLPAKDRRESGISAWKRAGHSCRENKGKSPRCPWLPKDM